MNGNAVESDATATTTIGVVLAANVNRQDGIIQNNGAVNVLVTTVSNGTTGFTLLPNGLINIGGTTCAWYAKSASSTAALHILEIVG